MEFREADLQIEKQLKNWLDSTQSTPINRSVSGFIEQAGQSLDMLSDARIGAFIYNFTEGNYYYFNDYFAHLMGVTRSYIESAGIRITQEKVHPEDFLKCLNITHQALQQFGEMKDAERETTQFRFFFRLRQTGDDYSWVMQSNRHVKWDPNLPSLDLAYIVELFNESHPFKVMGVLQTSKRSVEIFPSGEIELLAQLTAREMEILRLIAGGLASKEISEKLVISENTVKSHRKNILHKLQVKNMMQAVNILATLNR